MGSCGGAWGQGPLISGVKTQTVLPGCQPEPSVFPVFTLLVMTDV